jgi:hypothetical protein
VAIPGPCAAWAARRLAARALLALLAALGSAGPAAATHLPDHRFVVLGYARDAAGRALAGAPVVVTRLRTGLQYPTRTEADGFYLVVVHLHDEDRGERLAVRIGAATLEVEARFDPRDRKVERGTRVDARAERLTEDRRAFAETLRAWLAR